MAVKGRKFYHRWTRGNRDSVLEMDVGIPWNNLLNNERDLDEIEKKYLHIVSERHISYL